MKNCWTIRWLSLADPGVAREPPAAALPGAAQAAAAAPASREAMQTPLVENVLLGNPSGAVEGGNQLTPDKPALLSLASPANLGADYQLVVAVGLLVTAGRGPAVWRKSGARSAARRAKQLGRRFLDDSPL